MKDSVGGAMKDGMNNKVTILDLDASLDSLHKARSSLQQCILSDYYQSNPEYSKHILQALQGIGEAIIKADNDWWVMMYGEENDI